MKYSPVPVSNVDEETPRPPQGETTAKPIPAPKDKRSRVNAQEAAAPAITAAQLTPERRGLYSFSRNYSGGMIHVVLQLFLPTKCAAGTNGSEKPEFFSWLEEISTCEDIGLA